MTFMKTAVASALVLLCGLASTSSAGAAFGLEPGSVDAMMHDANGNSYTQAGGHPHSLTTEFMVNSKEGGQKLDGTPLRNVTVEAPPGFVADPSATPRCSLADFLGAGGITGPVPCPDSTQVGLATTEINLWGTREPVSGAIYNLKPQPGQPALFGFYVVFIPVIAVPSLREEDYGFDINVLNIEEGVPVFSNRFTFWGEPASPAHDAERGSAAFNLCYDGTKLPCDSDAPRRPFLTAPADCEHGPFLTVTTIESWLGETDSEGILTHDDLGGPVGVTGCDRVPFEPSISASATTDAAETPTGFDFELKIPDTGIKNPDGIAQSNLKKAVVKLPQGVTVNPSSAEGLGICRPADFAREKLETPAGAGCPNQSKIGSVEIQSPLLEDEERVEGGLFLGQPDDPATGEPGAENQFDSLLSLYVVARVPDRGVIVKIAGKVEPDPRTGQLTTIFDDLPQLPFSSFKLHFREGGRAPLVSAPSCGPHTTEAELTPYSAPGEPVHREDVFPVLSGVGGGPCPEGGAPPFRPSFEAGSINNNAKSFSPFQMRLLRADGEQNMTRFSATLPPGVLGRLAGIARCPEAAIAAAASRSGREELASPSCPAQSQIGRALVGAGVGSVLTYVPGRLYLAGPYQGAPLSVVVVTPAVAGPFDVGTVVTREALTLNPDTAEVEVDGSASNPIPHILEGIPLKLRDLRVYVDRDSFILNPTSCDPSSAKATLFGSFLDVFSAADDRPVSMATRYQAANCGTLPFKPRLRLRLKGGTVRGAHPALRAVLRTRPADANIGAASVILPKSAFLEQAHIRTVCSRLQFAADRCPKGSIYGYARATTPLLDEPIEGPVYLRSSNHELPDLVASLRGLVEVNVVGRIDSSEGRLRSSFESVPDAPVTKFVLEMRGGRKGLVVNSRNLCDGVNRARTRFVGQNGKAFMVRPAVETSCGKRRKR